MITWTSLVTVSAGKCRCCPSEISCDRSVYSRFITQHATHLGHNLCFLYKTCCGYRTNCTEVKQLGGVSAFDVALSRPPTYLATSDSFALFFYYSCERASASSCHSFVWDCIMMTIYRSQPIKSMSLPRGRVAAPLPPPPSSAFVSAWAKQFCDTPPISLRCILRSTCDVLQQVRLPPCHQGESTPEMIQTFEAKRPKTLAFLCGHV